MRSYNDTKKVPPLTIVKPVVEQQRIPKDVKLYGIDTASKLLTEQYNDGFSEASLRRLVKSEFTEGIHYVRVGKKRLLKFHIDAIQAWVVGG
ncbi:MAG: hypothetical protein MUC48_21555 [Leptolyngbya sp. Prado105]|jgi:hypothetical protein|nr:hypothetical protein [Leptolyngbya sp. Prado105]